MERLLNLLQEFYWEDRKFINENWLLTMTNWVVNLSGAYAQTYIISKKGWFIKWLVENEKIDYEKIEKQTKCKNIVGWKEFLDFDIERDFTPYEEVLMWLAIQDEPIEFLVSILK